jgi:AraC family transcriptional regulator, arabinose operon regulatory protein
MFPALLARLSADPCMSEFLVTKSGYFPRARHNAAWRPNPLHDTIVAVCVDGLGWVGDHTNPKVPRVVLREGEVLVIPPNTPHSYGADEQHPWTQLWFHATGPRVRQLLAELRVIGQPHKGRPRKLGPVKDSIRRINQLRLLGCGRAVLLECAALAELVFARLCAESCLEPVSSLPQPALAKHSADRLQGVQEIANYLHEHYREPLEIREVARACGVSESWLFHAFSEHTGFSPIGFATHLRLHEACRLLATSQRSLKDIGAAVGYDDPLYFSRVFKKHIGSAPSDYRREYGGMALT